MNRYHGMEAFFIILLILLGNFVTNAFGQGVPEEARRYMARGIAAVEMAETLKDYERAVQEFEQAAKLAPNWPDVYFNLGSVQAKARNYSEAMRHYKRYLELVPNAPDAAKIREEIYKLEYRAEQEASTLKNDDNIYQTVMIGNQVWMAENLRTTKYNDDTPIPLMTDKDAWTNATKGAYCYYNNTTNADSIKKYGALYNWYAVDTKKLAPAGWHVPTDAEWDILRNYLIANGYNWDGTITGNKIAKSMAAKVDWASDGTSGTIGKDLTTNNKSGFSALPGGYRRYNGNSIDIGSYGCWWSTTEDNVSFANYYGLGYSYGYLHRSRDGKSCGFSVRLVRD